MELLWLNKQQKSFALQLIIPYRGIKCTDIFLISFPLYESNTWLLVEMSLVTSYLLILKSNDHSCHISHVCTSATTITSITEILHIVQCIYSTKNCHLNPHNIHPIYPPWARAIRCSFRPVTEVLFSISQYIGPHYCGTQLYLTSGSSNRCFLLGHVVHTCTQIHNTHREEPDSTNKYTFHTLQP